MKEGRKGKKIKTGKYYEKLKKLRAVNRNWWLVNVGFYCDVSIFFESKEVKKGKYYCVKEGRKGKTIKTGKY